MFTLFSVLNNLCYERYEFNFFFFGCTTQLAGQFPDQGLNPRLGSESAES